MADRQARQNCDDLTPWDFWRSVTGPTDCRTAGPPDLRTARLKDCMTARPPDRMTARLQDCMTARLSTAVTKPVINHFVPWRNE